MGFEASIYRSMDLDKHFINFEKKAYVIKQTEGSKNYALDIIWFIKSHQVNRPLDQLLKKGEKYRAAIQRQLEEENDVIESRFSVPDNDQSDGSSSHSSEEEDSRPLTDATEIAGTTWAKLRRQAMREDYQ